jgi:hypothetical protein
MLIFGDLDDCRYYMRGVLASNCVEEMVLHFFFCILGCLTPEDLDEPELIGK